MPTGHLFIVSGPSGAGKGTLVKGLLDRVPDVWLSVSATTRAPRPGEVEGEHYFFVSRERFEELGRTGGLLEWAEVHGNLYGTPKAEVERRVARGRQVVLEIDPQGAQQVKKRWPEAVLIFVEPPSMEELRRRLEGRGSEDEAQIETRMRTAMSEMELAGMYNHVICNDDMSSATQELADIVTRYANQKD